MNIGSALMAADVAAVGLSFAMYGPSTGLFSVMGLVAKSMVVDNVIENMNLCKCFNIVCEHPQPICNFIIHELNRSATTFEARGAYSDAHKTVIMTTMRRSQAIRLRNFIRQQEPTDLYHDRKLQRDQSVGLQPCVKKDLSAAGKTAQPVVLPALHYPFPFWMDKDSIFSFHKCRRVR